MTPLTLHQDVAFFFWSAGHQIEEIYRVAVGFDHECLSGYHEFRLRSETEFLIEEVPTRLERPISELLIFLLVVAEHSLKCLDSQDPIFLAVQRLTRSVRIKATELGIAIPKLPTLAELLGSNEPGFREPGEEISTVVEAGRILGTLKRMLPAVGNILWQIPMQNPQNTDSEFELHSFDTGIDPSEA